MFLRQGPGRFYNLDSLMGVEIYGNGEAILKFPGEEISLNFEDHHIDAEALIRALAEEPQLFLTEAELRQRYARIVGVG